MKKSNFPRRLNKLNMDYLRVEVSEIKKRFVQILWIIHTNFK
jgi:hypothetical protein